MWIRRIKNIYMWYMQGNKGTIHQSHRTYLWSMDHNAVSNCLQSWTAKRTCSKCGKEEYRTNGNNLTPTIRTNAASLKFKKKQSTSKFKITGLAKGDYIKSFTSSNKKLITITGNKTGTCKIKAANKTGKTKITITLASGLKKTITVTIQKKPSQQQRSRTCKRT